jgi:hypothetical protein
MVLGLRLSDTPPLVGKKVSSLTTLSTMWIVMILGILSYGSLCRVGRILHYLNSPFDLGYVLIGACQIDHGATWYRLNQGLERREFAVGVHRLDVETTLEIVLIHLFKSLEYLRNRAILELIYCREAIFLTECQEERNLVDKEDVGCS